MKSIRKLLKQTFSLKMVRNERGSIMIIGYFVIAILLGIGVVFVAMINNDMRIAERQRLATVAFHIAEAGVERALYDLRQDFILDSTSPSWDDGDINGYAIGPDTVNYYSLPYAAVALNGGTYAIELKNASADDIWVKSTGTIAGVSHTLSAYVKMIDISPWNNAIFAGAGASGATVNGNVNIRGSVHVLGTGLNSGDLAIDLGGTAELVGNNYNGLAASLEAKVPALPTTSVNGETVETLNASLRVKRGMVGLSGSSTVGETDAFGNGEKELVDGAYVTDGYSGNQGAANVNSDNGTSNGYDLGNSVSFPSLSDPYGGQANYKAYLQSLGGYTVTNAAELAQLASITPTSSFTIGSGANTITMDGAGNMTVSGIVIVSNGGSFNTAKAGAAKTITYAGTGAIYVDGNVQINTNLVTSGAASFPTNIVGIMTPGNVGFNEASIDVMGLFYAEGAVVAQKQTDIMGTIVSNYFDMGTNVPAIYQVPETVNNLPPGLIGSGTTKWYIVVAWMKT